MLKAESDSSETLGFLNKLKSVVQAVVERGIKE